MGGTVGGRPYRPSMGLDPCVYVCLHMCCVDMSVPALLSPRRSLYRYLGVNPVCVCLCLCSSYLRGGCAVCCVYDVGTLVCVLFHPARSWNCVAFIRSRCTQ